MGPFPFRREKGEQATSENEASDIRIPAPRPASCSSGPWPRPLTKSGSKALECHYLTNSAKELHWRGEVTAEFREDPCFSVFPRFQGFRSPGCRGLIAGDV